MWYVNIRQALSTQDEPLCFILTMWYVNFKVSEIKTDLCFSGFILTMWYVNVLLMHLEQFCLARFILTMWYVNVVSVVISKLPINCFILTMWYVNRNNVSEVDSNINCFILTMWYVNLIEWGYSINGYFGFYINYVICKCVWVYVF